MEAAAKEPMLFKRSMKSVLLLSAIYAVVSNVYLYSAYFNSSVIEWSYLICTVMVIAFVLPIVKLFRNQHWYFPAFIFLFWIPFSVLLAFVLSQVLPVTDDYVDFGLLLVYCLILNVAVMVLSIALGMIINTGWMLWHRMKQNKK
ncbi:hypothetical protein [Bacillus sp. FJAT-26390]|uniref:hypothetical protein n=1 Tax=Bacillus sp. FJAT-26390 TaxID=1743142 RepID=UPI0008081826|nr:hypothetical protein [Bacillus sp. FJAT-26390]OBZ10034.1 hypothetical protein A7975_21950 [Bacillus sp. FJAT-26390]